MQSIFESRWFHVALAGGMIVTTLWLLASIFTPATTAEVTTSVERGPVTQLVSVSGVVEAEDLAELAFPVGGIVESVLVEKGQHVKAGEVLIKLSPSTLAAERSDAVAALTAAKADRDELIAGPRTEARAVTEAEVANARENLARTKSEQAEKVANARRALLSNSLVALTTNSNEDATPPTVSGTYACDTEGIYSISVYASDSESGYSFRLSGLESGSYSAPTEQSTAIGSCGLRLQFADTGGYNNSEWTITIPNPNASNYTTLKNAYDLAKEQAQNAIAAAADALTLAEQEALLANATPRSEELARANAAVTQAAARLARIDAQLADRTLTAPFAGTVTNIDILPGETAGTAPVVTLIADNTYELTIRIPEIDITKVNLDQRADVIFDANTGETLTAMVDFISPAATEIDSVAYYEATLTLDNPPAWLRSGLNADVDIIVAESDDTLRVPKRFVYEIDGQYYVLQKQGNTIATTTIDVGLVGNDGYVEIIGINEGDSLVAP